MKKLFNIFLICIFIPFSGAFAGEIDDDVYNFKQILTDNQVGNAFNKADYIAYREKANRGQKKVDNYTGALGNAKIEWIEVSKENIVVEMLLNYKGRNIYRNLLPKIESLYGRPVSVQDENTHTHLIKILHPDVSFTSGKYIYRKNKVEVHVDFVEEVKDKSGQLIKEPYMNIRITNKDFYR